LEGFLQLLILNLTHFLLLLSSLIFSYNLLLKFDSMFLQKLLALVLEFLLQFSDFPLLTNHILELRFLCSCLLL